MKSNPNNPLHGITLEMILNALVDQQGWEAMAKAVPIRCFSHEPSVKSSLTFLRRTPWARTEVEALYLKGKVGPGRQTQKNPPPFV